MAFVNVLTHEKFMNDASSTVFANLKTAAQKKSNDFYDESYTMPLESNFNGTLSQSQYEYSILEERNDWNEEEKESCSWDCFNTFDSTMKENGASDFRLRSQQKVFSNHYLSTQALKHFKCAITKKSRVPKEKGMPAKEPEDVKKKIKVSMSSVHNQRNARGNKTLYEHHHSKRNSGNNEKDRYNCNLNEGGVSSGDKFNVWCRERKNQFSAQQQHDVKRNPDVKISTQARQLTLHDKVSTQMFAQQKFISQKSVSDSDQLNKMLIITVYMKDEKCYETITDMCNFLRVNKAFPKFSEVLPEVDAGQSQLMYSADAVKSVLGFLFNPSCNFNSIRNETTAVEVLALTYFWGITKFRKLYQAHFLKNILSERNASKIYSLTNHFKLHEVQKACLRLLKDNTDLMTYKQKKCSVAVSTYVDPLEFSIILHPPAEKQLSESFDRSIHNEIEFESLSGSYAITGFQIQLNVDEATINSNSKLTVFYSADNITEQGVPEQKKQRNLGSTIILYFNKTLLIKPKQKGKISVNTDLKPCLCYTYDKNVIENENFRLTLSSNYKVQKTDRRVFFIGKLYYHVNNATV